MQLFSNKFARGSCWALVILFSGCQGPGSVNVDAQPNEQPLFSQNAKEETTTANSSSDSSSCSAESYYNAIWNNRLDDVQKLLKSGCSANLVDSTHTPIINLARRWNRAEILTELCASGITSRFCKLTFDSSATQGLIQAAKNGNVVDLKRFLDQGASPDGLHSEQLDDVALDTFPLLEAAGSGNLEILEILLRAGARIDIQIGYAGTLGGNLTNALVDATHKGQAASIAKLISAGADLGEDYWGSPYPGALFTALFGVWPEPSTLLAKIIQNSDARGLARLYRGTAIYVNQQYRSDMGDRKKKLLAYFDQVVTGVSDVNIPDHPEVPLELALQYQDLETLNALLDKSARTDVRFRIVLNVGHFVEEESPLGFAFLTHADPKMIQRLLKAGASVNDLAQVDGYGKLSLLAVAALSTEFSEAELKILSDAGADLNIGNPLVTIASNQDQNHQSHAAADIAALIERGASPNVTDASGTPLFHLIVTSDKLRLGEPDNAGIRLLKALTNSKYDFGAVHDETNALALCAQWDCRAEELEFLMSVAHAPVNNPDDGCKAPLRFFMLSSKLPTALFDEALKLGANPNSQCDHEPLLLDFLKHFYRDIADQAPVKGQKLIAAGAEVKTAPVYDALFQNNYVADPQYQVIAEKIIDMLHAGGADARMKDGAICNLVQRGAWGKVGHGAPWTDPGMAALIGPLVKAGADVNQKTVMGAPPLHVAITSGFTETVKALCQNGANANIMFGNETLRKIAQDLADQSHDQSIVEALGYCQPI